MAKMGYVMESTTEADDGAQAGAQGTSTCSHNTTDMQDIAMDDNLSLPTPERKRGLKPRQLKLPDYNHEPQASNFLAITQDINYGKFAADVQIINASPVLRRTMERLWKWTICEYFQLWKTSSGSWSAGKSRTLLDAALAQVDGYESFDADAHWRIQSLTNDIGSMSVDSVPGKDNAPMGATPGKEGVCVFEPEGQGAEGKRRLR